MNNPELIADVFEALEEMKFWRPIYETLLRTCRTKQEAIKALKYLINIKQDIEGGRSYGRNETRSQV